MDETEFARLIADEVYRYAVLGTLSNLAAPPGRRPAEDLVRPSAYRNLSTADQEQVAWVAASAAHHAIFGTLALIDGEKPSEFDRYELVGVRDGERQAINPEDRDRDLHDEFQAIVMTDHGALRVPGR
jgi:hypothetical protein